ncbi:prepilin peptidase [Paenibacillus popilliae]|uniref:Prepilin signal peptidase n=1 Tax=Paenibacillus popilliae ATCC 14706 TaxID=1212764 RepID=M9M483_PAEPP|nr:A24 family peptidase [Paenibacillus popilliae]GAC42088.1 prepilin signal peptidase [Paenibacillus popilliae ATCC 14706]
MVVWVILIMAIAAYQDLKYRIIPDRLLGVGTIGSILIWACWGEMHWWECILGAIVVGGILFLGAYLSNGGIGGGDIKLMAWLGASTGFIFAASVLLLGTILAFFYGMLHQRWTQEKSFPLAHCFFIAMLITYIFN